MKNILEYRGYSTRVEFSEEDRVLFGKIEGIRDLVNYECENAGEVETAFHDAVDDYLKFCHEVGKTPDKEYKGTFNVRIAPELHKKASMVAYQRNQSLNQVVEKAIEEYVNENHDSQISLKETVVTLTTALAMTSSAIQQTSSIKPIYPYNNTGNRIKMKYLEQ